jgi:hypothetical protein
VNPSGLVSGESKPSKFGCRKNHQAASMAAAVPLDPSIRIIQSTEVDLPLRTNQTREKPL